MVVGDDPGSKLDKARSLGVPTLDEAAFVALVGDGGPGEPQLDLEGDMRQTRGRWPKRI